LLSNAAVLLLPYKDPANAEIITQVHELMLAVILSPRPPRGRLEIAAEAVLRRNNRLFEAPKRLMRLEFPNLQALKYAAA
jgi:hypothetical protein